MKLLQFRLATLLRLREAVRDERRRQLAETTSEAEAISARRDKIDGELERSKPRLSASAGWVDAQGLQDAARYQALLRHERGQADRERAAIDIEIEKLREALFAADRDVRMLERLHETHQRRQRLEEERRRMKELDEAALRRHSLIP